MNRKVKILVVDDQPGMRLLLEQVLKEENYQVSTAAKGSNALGQVEQDSPQLLLVDMKMPEMNGLELVERLEALQLNLKVVLMSADHDEGVTAKARELGVEYFINKPFNIEELLQLIAKIVAGN